MKTKKKNLKICLIIFFQLKLEICIKIFMTEKALNEASKTGFLFSPNGLFLYITNVNLSLYSLEIGLKLKNLVFLTTGRKNISNSFFSPLGKIYGQLES